MNKYIQLSAKIVLYSQKRKEGNGGFCPKGVVSGGVPSCPVVRGAVLS